ncbi:MAG: dihydropteroate synthase [Candidatus Rokubacteria bacterium]|nr:dihydropteroate synthase [Candidatus Rokubacteria bacterium]
MTPARAQLAGVPLGAGHPVAVMGVLNVSPESFHAGSVRLAGDDLLRAALAMVEAGAALIDVGARSTAPYLPTAISEAEERDRLAPAIELLAAKLPVPVSADTARPAPARAALEAGARIINDVTGLRDPGLAELVAAHGAGVILMASPEPGAGGAAGGSRPRALARRVGLRLPYSAQRAGRSARTGRRTPAAPPSPAPINVVTERLASALRRARRAGIPEERIVLDPGIGFFRDEGVAWPEWDVAVLAGLGALRRLGRPLCVGVSRKSFLGVITGREATADRLPGSLAATAVAVLGGVALVRAHDVAEALDAIRVAERIRQARMARTVKEEGPRA